MARVSCILPTVINSIENGVMINVSVELTNLPTEIFLKEKLARVPSKMER